MFPKRFVPQGIVTRSVTSTGSVTGTFPRADPAQARALSRVLAVEVDSALGGERLQLLGVVDLNVDKRVIAVLVSAEEVGGFLSLC